MMIIIIITVIEKIHMPMIAGSQQAGGVVSSHSFILSFVLFVSRITHERVNGRRPNMVGMDEG